MRQPEAPIALTRGHLQATDGKDYPLRRLAWSGAPILDACLVQADYGQLLILTDDGALHGIDTETAACRTLCRIELPDLGKGDTNPYFGTHRYRLHASSDGRHAAIVVDFGCAGIVVEIASGRTPLHLDGGDYHSETVPFSTCFFHHQGRELIVHRSAWNRLEVSDPATGVLLTERNIAAYEAGKPSPEHYLDYFHGRLRPSPDGQHLFDDGWVWQPVAVPRVWSVNAWLNHNPWESEDGSSIAQIGVRDDWNIPACWIDERHIALWGLADWDEDEFEETSQGPGVRISDVTEGKSPSARKLPLAVEDKQIFDLFSDGRCLYVAAETGTSAWDLATGEALAAFPGFVARLHERTQNAFVSLAPDEISVLALAENHRSFTKKT